MDSEKSDLNSTPAEADSAQTKESAEIGKSENRFEKEPARGFSKAGQATAPHPSIQYQDPQSTAATGAQKLVRRARIILMAAESNPRLDQDMENPNRSRLYGLKRLFAVIREAGAPFR